MASNAVWPNSKTATNTTTPAVSRTHRGAGRLGH